MLPRPPWNGLQQRTDPTVSSWSVSVSREKRRNGDWRGLGRCNELFHSHPIVYLLLRGTPEFKLPTIATSAMARAHSNQAAKRQETPQ